MKRRILFTGGTGFIGRSIIPELRRAHDVFAPTRKELNLFDADAIGRYISKNAIDGIIHAAAAGASRSRSEGNIYDANIKIFDSLFQHVDDVDFFINFDSGAIFDKTQSISNKNIVDIWTSKPKDPYGLSKVNNAVQVLAEPKAVNLRLYGCFGPLEDRTRFISTCIYNAHHNLNLNVNDMYMDFFYVDDLIPVLNYCMDYLHLKDVDLVYPNSGLVALSHIAREIYGMSKSSGNIIVNDELMPFYYCGNFHNLNSLNLKLKGLMKGLYECYDYSVRKRLL